MKKIKRLQRIMSIFICIALLMSFAPMTAGAEIQLQHSDVVGVVTDPGTADTWETMMGTSEDGNRYAGRVWVDKSVYQDGDTAVLNNSGEDGSFFRVSLEDDEAFQIIFSALGSTMTTKKSETSTGPMDVVLVLDTSTSMEDEDTMGVTRLERTVTAANQLLDDLLTIRNVRIAIVTYNVDSETVLPLAAYHNGIHLVVTDYYDNGSSDAGVVTAYDDDGKKLGNDSGYTKGTNLQSGIDRGFNILANATDIEGRVPVAIVLTDGQANRADKEGFYEIASHDDKDGVDARDRNLYLSTLLNAAYNKTKIEVNYGKDATVYTVGVDITDNVVARLLMNPADTTYGFHSRNANNEVKKAYENFQKWANGQNVTYDGWSFDHNYPKLNGNITDDKIIANISYSDHYYDVTNADLDDTFEYIYNELSSSAFNPISSTTSVDGGTGVENTPLIYVDFIGQYMQIKEIQAITLFGNSYGVVKNADGTYYVTEATGINPTTNESWNTAEDIQISVTEQEDGTQKLEIRINQQILPIIMEQAVTEVIGDVSASTITELKQAPLRVYYTVGIDSDILLPGGEVDVSKIQGYPDIDDQNGTVSFYSNRYGVMNTAEETIVKGDAHVGFKPSAENRFYYHQTNQGIFTGITDKTSGKEVTISENNAYGILWDEMKYDLTWMSYEEYLNAKDTDKVYTYVSYFRPTQNVTDEDNIAEEVTYLVYTNWEYLKESVGFYDANSKTYLNDGKAIEQSLLADTIAAYLRNNPKAELYAVLGVGSMRTSRLHNMTVEKAANNTATATLHYAPEYTHETAAIHNGNDVVVWLGNNGKLTVQIDTGIALTKAVTEAIGHADDTYALTVTVPQGVEANPVVVDDRGEPVIGDYRNNVLTVNVKAGQTVYVRGIPGGTECEIGEIINGEYYIVNKTDQVRIPLVSEALNGGEQFVSAVVTNAPYKYGNLFITKEITSDHAVPESVMDTSFEITVNVGTALAGEVLTVEDSEHAEPYEITVNDDGNVVFYIKARQTIEILHLPEGTNVTVTESVPDSHFEVSYRTRNHSGENADDDNILVIPSEGSATAVVMNHYTPSAVSVDLDVVGTKEFTIEGSHAGGNFTYQLQKWNGTAWENIPGKTAQTLYAADESGRKTFTIENVLEGITYTEVGSHAYQVIEVKGDVTNVTYDRTLYTFNVTVTDHGGDLVASVTDLNNREITDGTYEVTFHNTYHTAPVSIDIIKEVDNRSGDTTVSKAGFGFLAVGTDEYWSPISGDDASELRVFTDAAGEARITATYKDAGVYYYVLTEIQKNAPGWTYSNAEYRVTVTVTEENGNLTAALDIMKVASDNPMEMVVVNPEDATKATVSFVNTYAPAAASVELDGAVSKVLTGMSLEAGQFTFYVYKDGDRTAPILTGTNDLAGDVNFVDFDQVLTFTSEGKYQYDVVEYIPAEAIYDATTGKYVLKGMSYDPTIYDLVVEVANDITTGKLIAYCYFEDAVTNVVTFRNSYKATPTEYTLAGTKILHGRAPHNGEFTFELYEGDELLQSVTNISDGSFKFRGIAYDQPGTYTYTIKEKMGNVTGIRYDGVEAPITVTVSVTDTDGILSATADVSNAQIRFHNTYTAAPAQVVFNGTKNLAGEVLEDNAFTFNLYSTDHSFDTTNSSAELLATAQNVNGEFTFERILSTTGTYYFAVLEDATVNPNADVVYDRSQYNFMVKVTDVGAGQLKAAVYDTATGRETGLGAGVSAQVSFTNAMRNEVTQKSVYLEGNTDIEIDGQKVNAGDVLTYFITYTNFTGTDVVAHIVDIIPEHTSFVEGSISHYGGYTGDHVNWILRVAKGRKITVSFSVVVNETEAIVANTATVRDGINVYYTNEVVNHTIEDELQKDVFAAGDPTISIDGQKVYEEDELVYRVSFTNTSSETVDVEITDAIPENTTYVDGSADQGGVYQDGVLRWSVTDVPAWSTVTVAFKVTVNAQIGAVTIDNQATATDGTNHYETAWVSNYTVEDEVKKDVFFAENPKISIDGETVKTGDELTYTITYKNTAKQTATVTVTDSIPQYTTYVEGSANHDGVYENEKLTWTLDVNAGEMVTLSFKVKVDEAVGATVKNKATVVEGKNTYTTNEVSNPVHIPAVPEIPKTDDPMDLQLLILVLCFSSVGLVAVITCGRKKEI